MRNNEAKGRWVLASAAMLVVIFAVAAPAMAQVQEPTKDFTIELKQGDSIEFDMSKYTMINSQLSKIRGSGTGLAEFTFEGTKADNKDFEDPVRFQTDARGVAFDSTNHWTKTDTGDGNLPRVRYTCTKNSVNLIVKILD